MDNKQQLGQFNTTKKDYVLSGFEDFMPGKQWVDPFAGNGDLLQWANQHGATTIRGCDVDPTKLFETRDTLLKPLNYSGSWCIANPPYLARNKNKNKMLYDQHGLNDLYKIAIHTITANEVEGGIFIVPINFLSSQRAAQIRDRFFEQYRIVKCKIFEETVFDDTDYPVCAFCYIRRENPANKDVVPSIFYPSGTAVDFTISAKYHWILGEEFYRWLNGATTQGVNRWTLGDDITPGTTQERVPANRDRNGIFINGFNNRGCEHTQEEIEQHEKEIEENPKKQQRKINLTLEKLTGWVCPICGKPKTKQYFKPELLKNIILIRAIDTGSNEGRIALCDIREHVAQLRKANKIKQGQPILLGLPTSRNLAHVKFTDPPSIEEQLRIIAEVNKQLEKHRKRDNSIFLTSFRNSTEHYSRKRIGFDQMYKMINKIRL